MEINTASPLVCQENSLQNRGRFNKINGQNQKNVCLIKKLNYLLTKLGTTRGESTSFPVLTDEYRENIIKRLS